MRWDCFELCHRFGENPMELVEGCAYARYVASAPLNFLERPFYRLRHAGRSLGAQSDQPKQVVNQDVPQYYGLDLR